MSNENEPKRLEIRPMAWFPPPEVPPRLSRRTRKYIFSAFYEEIKRLHPKNPDTAVSSRLGISLQAVDRYKRGDLVLDNRHIFEVIKVISPQLWMPDVLKDFACQLSDMLRVAFGQAAENERHPFMHQMRLGCCLRVWHLFPSDGETDFVACEEKPLELFAEPGHQDPGDGFIFDFSTDMSENQEAFSVKATQEDPNFLQAWVKYLPEVYWEELKKEIDKFLAEWDRRMQTAEQAGEPNVSERPTNNVGRVQEGGDKHPENNAKNRV